MSRRFGKKDGGGGGSPGWMTTFSDLMSLLLTFFILLYSMSNIDAAKFKQMSQSLQGVLSGLGYTQIVEGPSQDLEIPDEDPPIGEDTNTTLMQEIMEVYNTVMDYIDTQGLEANVSVSVNKRGVYVDIKEAILFEPARADLKDQGIGVLNKLMGIFKDFHNEISIEGYTDDVPINTPRFPSNWELSTARAVTVLRYLEEEGGIASKRLSATGYGEYRPMVPNTNAENRAINRRVNILIIFDEKSNEVIEDGYY